MAENDPNNEPDLVDETVDDEADARRQDRAARRSARERFANGVKFVGNGLKRFGINIYDKAKSFLEKVAKKVLQHILPALGTVLSAIVIIVSAIGLVAFIVNMPGFSREKFNEIVSNISKEVKSELYGENSKLSGDAITVKQRVDLLNYIGSDLGFDVIGFGFVPTVTYKTGTDENGEDYGGKQIIDENTYNTHLGYISAEDAEAEINSSNPDADLMYYYIMANERAYTINSDGIFGLFGKANAWKGMITIDKSILEKFSDLINNDDIECYVDREQKKLVIENHSYSDLPVLRLIKQQIDKFSFSMDGWTGRYGMPIEFSLALHISTMSSGLVKEMITNPDLQTEVNVGLQSVKCDVDYKFYVDVDGNVKEIKYYADEDAGGKSVIYDKIKNNEKLTEQDLTFQSIIYAKRRFANKYGFFLDGFSYDSGIHVEAMEALLSNRYLAVNLKTSRDNTNGGLYFDGITFSNSGEPVFAISETPTNQYGLYSGAYVCMYDSGLNPDENTGKIAYIERTKDENMQELGYSQFEKSDDSDASHETYWYINYKVDQNGSLVKNTDDYSGKNNYLTIPTGGLSEYNAQGVICISGLGITDMDNLLNNAYKDENNKVYLAYEAMFKEIDWFLMCAQKTKGINSLYYQGNYDAFMNANNGYDTDNVFYYTNQFRNLLDEESTAYGSEVAKARLERELNHDLEEIRKYLDSTPENKEKFDEQMKAAGIDPSKIQEISNKFEASGATEIKEILYTQPYIKKVIKHWFKDVIFEDDELNYSVYEMNNEPFELEYNPEEGDPEIEGVDIRVLLTPQEKDEGIYEQKEQPYVVKGNVVLKDGKKVDVDVSEAEDDGYHYGDGYRATKKIFTQGFYYTFDGSAETAKSIFWQQQIENMEGSTVRVTVINGRIYNVAPVSGGSELITDNNTQDIASDGTDANKNPSNPNVSFAGNIKARFNDDGTIARGAGANYILRINNMKYISPTEADYDIVKERVDYINDIWEAMGVSSLRKHVSFDNVTSSGEVIANTGLSILKNCDTKDADYIYRDLKEMLIDLGYYTEAEFDQLDVKLKWFIPRYNPKQWPQNSVEDFAFASVLYPREGEYDENQAESEDINKPFYHTGNVIISEQASSTKDESEDEKQDSSSSSENGLGLSTAYSKEKGFRSGLDVVAPGACKVTEVSGDTIEIEFDGYAQPEISSMNGYKMTIVGINPAVSVGTSLEAGEKIAETGTQPIKVFLKNDIGRLLSNVSDYMSPGRAGNQPYEFTDDEIVLLAYIINHEGAPEGLVSQMQHEIDIGYINSESYEDAWSAALAFAEGIGYVLTNRTLLNYSGYGDTIEQQSTAPGQYDGSFTIEYALAHQGAISAGSWEAALTVATYDCDIILKPDDPGVQMSRDVTGQSAWQFGHQIFWWLDMEEDGVMQDYPTSPGAPGYPTNANWPWDGYLTYTN